MTDGTEAAVEWLDGGATQRVVEPVIVATSGLRMVVVKTTLETNATEVLRRGSGVTETVVVQSQCLDDDAWVTV